MNIDPTASQILDQMPIYNPIDISFDNEGENEASARAIGQPPVGNSLTAIERQFSQLVRGLTQQLNDLERQLAHAIKVLGTPAKKPCDPDDHGAKAPAGSGPHYQRYGKIITDAARRHEVDPLLVNAVIRQESGFSATAVSKAGAMGLMQLMPDTAKALGVRDAFDPRQNIEGGTQFLRHLLDRYNGHVDLALAAYNAGPAAVDKYGGIPPYPETQAYVRDVMEAYKTAALSA
jgi:soluble lytic murein transglycosylase-like protein